MAANSEAGDAEQKDQEAEQNESFKKVLYSIIKEEAEAVKAKSSKEVTSNQLSKRQLWLQAQEMRHSKESDSTVIELLGQILRQLQSLNYYASPDSGAAAHDDDAGAAAWMSESKNKKILLNIHKLTVKMREQGHERHAMSIRDSLNEALMDKKNRKRILNEEIYDLEQRMRL